MSGKWAIAHFSPSGPGSQGHPIEGTRMTDHDVTMTDLEPTDSDTEQIKGGAPLVINLGALGTISISIPGLGL